MKTKITYTPRIEVNFSDNEKAAVFMLVDFLDELEKLLRNEDDYLQIKVANQVYNFSRESIQNAYKFASKIYASETAEVITTHEIETVKES